MERAPRHKGTLAVAEDQLKRFSEERENLEGNAARFAERVARHEAANENEPNAFTDIEREANAVQYARMTMAIEHLRRQEEELRGLLESLKEKEL